MRSAAPAGAVSVSVSIGRRPHVGAEMQGVGLERLARMLLRGLVKRARAEEVDDDRDAHDGERRGRRLDRVGLRAGKALDRLPDHHAAEHEQERGLGKRGQALHLAVAVMMLLVRRLVADAHREVGDYRGDEIDEGVGGFRQDRERAGSEPDRGLGDGQSRRGGDRGERDALLVGGHGRAVTGDWRTRQSHSVVIASEAKQSQPHVLWLRCFVAFGSSQ